MSKKVFSTRALAESVLVVALSAVLSFIKIYHLPQGGSITAGSMVPLIWISLRRGVKLGLFTCIVYGLVQFALEPYAYLFSRRAVSWIYLLPVAMLLVSVFIPRFWCRGFCPLGAVMQVGKAIRVWFLKRIPLRFSIPEARNLVSRVSPAPERNAVWLAFLPFCLIFLSNLLLFLLFKP